MLGMWCRVALAEMGVEYKEENLWNKNELHFQMNQVHKKIPVLIHNGKPDCESLIIVEYIDESCTKHAPLLSSNPYERARASFWTDYVNKKILAPLFCRHVHLLMILRSVDIYVISDGAIDISYLNLMPNAEKDHLISHMAPCLNCHHQFTII